MVNCAYCYCLYANAHKTDSENHVVGRGIKALGLVYHLTGRVPMLIKQSHLEEKEGSLTTSSG